MIRSRRTTDHALAVKIRPPFGERAKAVIPLSVSPASRSYRPYIHARRRGHRLNYRKPADPGGCRIPQYYYSREARCDFLEQFKPFSTQAIFELHEAGGIAARLRQTIDETGADWIGDIREHDRHAAGRLQQRRHGRVARPKYDVRRERDQFGRVSANEFGICPRPSAYRSARCGRRSSLIPGALCTNAATRACPSGSSTIAIQHADPPHPIRRLRPCHYRPRRRAAERRDELAPLHGHPSRTGPLG